MSSKASRRPSDKEIKEKIAELEQMLKELKAFPESSDLAKGMIAGRIFALEWAIGLREEFI